MDLTAARAEMLAVQKRIAAEKAEEAAELEAPEEEPEGTEPEEFYECYAIQRRFLEGCLQRATARIDTSIGLYPNPRDRETQIQLAYADEVGITFCNTTFHGKRPTTIKECADRMVEAEGGSAKFERKIDQMQDYINELKDEIFQLKGKRK